MNRFTDWDEEEDMNRLPRKTADNYNVWWLIGFGWAVLIGLTIYYLIKGPQ